MKWIPILLLLVGCSTVCDPYVPKTIGSIPVKQGAIEFTISPTNDCFVIGDNITIDYEIKSEEPIPFLDEVEIRYYMVYANGRKDNSLGSFTESKFIHPFQISPLQNRKGQFTIKTYYFSKCGITEIRAEINCPKPINDIEVWSGKLKSNRYGIEVECD